MSRERVLKVVLLVLGLFFMAGLYPIVTILWHGDESTYGDAMMLSLYFALGVFLLFAARDPAANRSLIAFTAWSSFAHAAVMTVQTLRSPSYGGGLLGGVAVLFVIGIALLLLTPAKHAARPAPAPGI